jgi:hypothetical protein
MATNRRKFLQGLGLGTGAALTGIPNISLTNNQTISKVGITQIFNMCGYAAPKIDKVRIGLA